MGIAFESFVSKLEKVPDGNRIARVRELIKKWKQNWERVGRCKDCNVPDNLNEGLCGDCYLKMLFKEIEEMMKEFEGG